MSTSSNPSPKPSFFKRLGNALGFGSAHLQERARLEAFLAAFPGEYCGWASDGTIAYSKGFSECLNLGDITSFEDIQNAINTGDAAALEGMFNRLRTRGIPFAISVNSSDGKRMFKISGSQGQSLSAPDHFDVLWIEDITDEIATQSVYLQENETLDQERKRFEAVLNAVPRPLWVRDKDQKITWVNNTYAEFLGQNKTDILSEQKEIFGTLRKKPEADKRLPGADLAKAALAENKAIDSRVHTIVKGQRMLMNISEMPLSANDPAQASLGIAYNVTREEELEGELKRYHVSNRELLEQLRSAIAIYNTDKKLEFYNSAFTQLWGLEEKWLNTMPRLGEIMEKLREDRRLPEQADFRRYKQTWLDMFTGLLQPSEDMLYLPDGTALRMLVVPHSQGGLMMTFEDVTSRLELESSYNTLIAVQKETLDNLEEAVAVYGSDGRLKLWNPAFAEQWKIQPEALEGEPHIAKILEMKKSFFEKKDWEKIRETMHNAGLKREIQQGRLRRRNNTLLEFSTVPLPDGGVLITTSDITDSARVEEALRDKTEALETAERLKMDFLANVSYQLRTPLNAIMGFNEMLAHEYFGPLNEKQKSYTGDIDKASHRLLTLIDDILDLSTLEAGYMTLEREEFKVRDMLQTTYDLVIDWTRKENIELHLKCPKNIGTLIGDERRLQQALINIIRNAINFTPAGGDIFLYARRGKAGITIFVEDTGIGIRKEDKERIFKPFERAHGVKSKDQMQKSGVGLGLSLVKKIAALHDGWVELESKPKQGTKASIFIPFNAQKVKLKLPMDQA